MKNNIVYISIALGLSIMTEGCISIGSSDKDAGQPVTKNIAISSEFNSIVTTGIVDIDYVQGPTSLTLTAPEKVIECINIEVRGGVLYVEDEVEMKLNNYSNIKNAKLTVSAPSVSNFSTSGVGDIDISRINAEEISLVTSGTGDIDLQTARCTKLNASSLGTGDIEINHLTCVVVDCNTSGVGDITLDRLVAERISGVSSGTGDIKVSGECKEENLLTTGTGDINKRGLEILKPEED